MGRKTNSIKPTERRVQDALLILQILVLIVLVGLAIVIGISMIRRTSDSAPPVAVPETITLVASSVPTGVIPPTQPIAIFPSPSISAEISTPSATPTRTPIPTPTAFNNALAAYTVDALSARVYDGGVIQLDEKIAATEAYDRWMFSYLSEGIRVTGLAHIPSGEPPFPVLILLHGGASQAGYYPGWGTDEIADTFARHGYLTLAPDYRTYNGTEGTSSPLKLPWVIDVMSLIASLPSLPQADSTRLGVLGHSRGGGIATHIMVMSPEIDAVSLYASLSADEAANWKMYDAIDDVTWPEEDALTVGSPTSNPLGYALISPINFLDRIDFPVQIHHGTWDGTVPIEWSRDLYARMQQTGINAELYEYPEQPHTFTGAGFTLFLERNIAFFDKALGAESANP